MRALITPRFAQQIDVYAGVYLLRASLLMGVQIPKKNPQLTPLKNYPNKNRPWKKIPLGKKYPQKNVPCPW
jgi:hypothetical protein